MEDESQRIHDLLAELDDEGDYVPERSSAHRAWIDKHFNQLHSLVEVRGQPFSKIAKKLAAEITIAPSTLQRHYEIVKQKKEQEEKERKRVNRRANRKSSAGQSDDKNNSGKEIPTSTVPRRRVDPSTVKPPPPLVHAEVVEE